MPVCQATIATSGRTLDDELRAETTLVAHTADDAALRDGSGPLRLITDERAHAVRQLRRLRLP